MLVRVVKIRAGDKVRLVTPRRYPHCTIFHRESAPADIAVMLSTEHVYP